MKAFRIALVDINFEGEYEDCCTLYKDEMQAEEVCKEWANKLKKILDYDIKPFQRHPWQYAKICKQTTTIKIVYECKDKNKRRQYIGYTTYILK